MEVINTKNVDRWDLINLCKFLNIKGSDFKLLIEAYRRKNLSADIKAYDYPYLGFGSVDEYKRSKYFKASKKIVPNQYNWYCLTATGQELLKTIESYLPIPDKSANLGKINEILYRFK